MASVQGELAGTVVTGLRRRAEMVAPPKGSLESVVVECERVRVRGEEGVSPVVKGPLVGRRSLAASQSSSTN